jgi:hypothetical protein
MPDWQEIARQRLTPLALEAKRQEEIVAELAGHLEDLYEDLVRQGKSEVEAVQAALSSVADWDELRREIQLAANDGGIMKYRIKALWLPGVCTSALSMLLLRLLQIRSAPAPNVLWLRYGVAFVVYWRWLLSLPAIGALGAYWSRRAGGRLVERVLAASLHIVGLSYLMVLGFCLAVIIDFRVSLSVQLVAFAMYILGWGIAPFLLLLLGALPFLRGDAGESRPAAASH